MEKIITTIIKDCIQCPEWLKCKPSKALTAPQRFAALTSSKLNKAILKDCLLKDAPKTERSNVELHKKAHTKLHNALDELFADYIIHHPDEMEFTEMPLIKLMTWSHEQTSNPTKS